MIDDGEHYESDWSCSGKFVVLDNNREELPRRISRLLRSSCCSVRGDGGCIIAATEALDT
jgi:hypothetical protein